MDAIEKLIGAADVHESEKYIAALAEPDRRKRPSVDMNHPEAGYYRVKEQGKWEPYRYLYEKGELYCCKGRNEEWLDLNDAIEKFSWAWDNPVSKETYSLVMKGGRWPDLDEAVEPQMRRNRPPQDEFENFKTDIENAAAAVERYKEINDDAIIEAAQSARARLNELARNVDKRREELVAPALKEQKDINGKWMPMVKAAKAAADAISRALGAWETKKIRAQRAAEEAAQREADRAIAQGTPPSAMEAPEPTPVMPAPRTQIKGGYGRAANVRIVKVIDQVTDRQALALAYYERDSVWSEIMRCAARDVENGHTPPGVTITEEGKVR